MPELPEVEACRSLLEQFAVGATVLTAVVADDEKVFVGGMSAQFTEALEGARLVAAHRLGKHMWLETDRGQSLLVHLGMTGSWSVKDRGSMEYKSFTVDTKSWPPRFSKLVLSMSNGEQLCLTDPRRFARVRLSSSPRTEPPISLLRGDPLLAPHSKAEFTASLSKRVAAIKSVLLDQAFTAGVGNWVADEALYAARVHPETPASALGGGECEALHEAIGSVCRAAVAVNAESSRFPEHWMFHVRWGKKAGKLGGHAIAFETVGGRTSCYVPALQKKASAAKRAAPPPAGAPAVKRPRGGGRASVAARSPLPS